MAWRFLEPCNITVDAGVVLRARTALPQVYTASPLSEDVCQQLARTVLEAHEAGLSWESRTRHAPGAATAWGVSPVFRRCRSVAPTQPGLEQAFEAMEGQARHAFGPLGLKAGERLRRISDQCLIYQQGDHVGEHADDAAGYLDERGARAWHVIKPERHVVGVMWLTRQTDEGAGPLEFAGGELRFNALVDEDSGHPLVVRPAPGGMVVFPASAWFRHEVLPVQAGLRIALTRWWEVVPDVDSP